MKGLCGVAAVLTVSTSVALAGPAAAQTSAEAFYSQSTIAIPQASRWIDSVDETGGCGTPPGGGAIDVDGDPSEWDGEPTWISGTARYDGGEWIWTDYAYDDSGTGFFRYPGEGEESSGADGVLPRGLVPGWTAFSKAPPRVQRYGNNAADPIELRLAADASYLYVLVRLSFLNALDSTVVGLGLDLDEDPTSGFDAWPLGAKIDSEGLELFLTAHGTCASLTDANGTQPLAGAGGAIRAGTRENVFEIAIPRSLLGGATTFRMVGGAGLWDGVAGTWMDVLEGGNRNTNDTDRPNNAASADDPAVFNLLFRDDDSLGEADAGATAGTSGNPRSLQTTRQREVLAGGTSGPYAVTIDLAKIDGDAVDPIPLRRGTETNFSRIYRSRYDTEGVMHVAGFGVFMGRYVPYGVYLPECYDDASCDWQHAQSPLLVMLHGGSGNHVTFYGYAGDYALASPVIVRPLGRGQRSPWYRGFGEADVLEVLEDAELRYGTNPERRVLAGPSLGGYGTLRIASLYPDLWTGVFPFCAAAYENSTSAREVGNVLPEAEPFVVDPLIPSLWNLPFRFAAGTIDPLVPITTDARLRDAAFAAGLDVRYTEHLLGSHCFDLPAAETWSVHHQIELADLLRRDRPADPARVRYRIDPRHFPAHPEPVGVPDIRDAGIRYGGAYWVSGLEVRPDVIAAAAAPGAPTGRDESLLGTIDVTSRAESGWDLTPESCGVGVGVGPGVGVDGNPDLTGGPVTPHLWQCQTRVAGGAAAEPRLDLAVRNLSAAAVELVDAGLSTASPFTVVAAGDGALALALGGAAGMTASGTCVNAATDDGADLALELTLSASPCTISVTP